MKDDIIRLARQAGCLPPCEGGDPVGLWEPVGGENVTLLMFRFAQLIAEECARTAEQTTPRHTECQNKIAHAIRERFCTK